MRMLAAAVTGLKFPEEAARKWCRRGEECRSYDCVRRTIGSNRATEISRNIGQGTPGRDRMGEDLAAGRHGWRRMDAPGARGRTRTGMGLPPRDFPATTAFAAARETLRPRRPGIWGLDFIFAVPRGRRGLGRGRQVSTLSARQAA